MIISALKVLELNERYNLVSGLGERDATNPEGVGLDLRVGKVHALEGDSFLGADETGSRRHSPEIKTIRDIEKHGNRMFIMSPGEYFLVTTIEEVYAPKEKIDIGGGFPPVYLIPRISPRTTLQRGGISLLHTKTDPGYRGPLILGLKNEGNKDFKFELGARMFNVVFEAVIGDINRPYTGQHQGGRVTSQGKSETQT